MIIFTNININMNINIYKIYNINKKNFINLLNNYKNFILDDDDYYCEYKKIKDCFIKHSYNDNKLSSIKYLNYSRKLHKENGPAIITYSNNGRLECKEYYINGKNHREDGPAWILYDENGEIEVEDYYLHDKEYSYENYVLEVNKLV